MLVILLLKSRRSGHRNLLLQRHILHRDVSINNLMYFCTKLANNTGKLIDLDLAADVFKLWAVGGATAGDLRTVSILVCLTNHTYSHFHKSRARVCSDQRRCYLPPTRTSLYLAPTITWMTSSRSFTFSHFTAPHSWGQQVIRSQFRSRKLLHSRHGTLLWNWTRVQK